MQIFDEIANMWKKFTIKNYPLKKLDMDLSKSFKVKGRCIVYSTRDLVRFKYLIIVRDELGNLQISDNDEYVGKMLEENLFNIESIIQNVLSQMFLRIGILQQIEKELQYLTLPLLIDVTSRSMLHITSKRIEQFKVGFRQNQVLDLRYLGNLSPEKINVINLLRQLGFVIWVEGEGQFFLETRSDICEFE